LAAGALDRKAHHVQFGLFMINGYICASAQTGIAAAKAAEAVGWESVWTGEHYVLPDPATEASPTSPRTPMLDPFIALAAIAAHTETLRLGTGLTIVPLHNPLMLAKQVASLDQISAGRFMFGVGVGYLAAEFEALGVPMAARGERTTDYLDAMRAIWSGEPAFKGKYVEYADVRAEPTPSKPPPLHFGGNVKQTYERVVTQGTGWYGWLLDAEATGEALLKLSAAQDAYDRPAELGKIEISVTPNPRQPLDESLVETYAQLGVTRLILVPPRESRKDAGELLRFVETSGELLNQF
jgi:probable F420-dependent oxidoreductase